MQMQTNRADDALRARAIALAESGHFDTVHAVRTALIAEGWANAGRVLESEALRNRIAERCHA